MPEDDWLDLVDSLGDDELKQSLEETRNKRVAAEERERELRQRREFDQRMLDAAHELREQKHAEAQPRRAALAREREFRDDIEAKRQERRSAPAKPPSVAAPTAEAQVALLHRCPACGKPVAEADAPADSQQRRFHRRCRPADT